MLRMSVGAFDQQGEPAGCVRFPTLREVNPFCEKLFHKQAQELRKQGSWKARFCGKMLRLPRKDCLVAAPELRVSLPSQSGPAVRQPSGPLAPLQIPLACCGPVLADVRRSSAGGAAASGQTNLHLHRRRC